MVPSGSTSRTLAKVSGRYVKKYYILLIHTDLAGHLDIFTACSNRLSLHLVTFTFDIITSTVISIQLTILCCNYATYRYKYLFNLSLNYKIVIKKDLCR